MSHDRLVKWAHENYVITMNRTGKSVYVCAHCRQAILVNSPRISVATSGFGRYRTEGKYHLECAGLYWFPNLSANATAIAIMNKSPGRWRAFCGGPGFVASGTIASEHLKGALWQERPFKVEAISVIPHGAVMFGNSYGTYALFETGSYAPQPVEKFGPVEVGKTAVLRGVTLQITNALWASRRKP